MSVASRVRRTSSRKVGSPGQVAAQHEHVHEEADHAVQRGVAPARDRRADQQVLAPAEAPQQYLERRQADHERGRARLARERREVLEPDDVAGIAGALRARVVDRQIERQRRAVERLAPVVELRVELEVLLPAGEVRVGVLDRFERQAGVGVGELGQEDAPRPAVEGDVVERQRQDVVAQQARAQQRAVGEVEADAELVVEVAAAADGDRGRPELDRDRLAVDAAVDRAQDRVALDQRAQRALQGWDVEHAGDAQRVRQVVAGVGGRGLVEEPEAPLPGRQRAAARALRHGRQRRLAEERQHVGLRGRELAAQLGRQRALRRPEAQCAAVGPDLDAGVAQPAHQLEHGAHSAPSS